MISEIAEQLVNELKSRVLFADVTAGLVIPTIKVDGKVNKTLPLGHNERDICNPSDLKSLLPDSKKKSIMFIEKDGDITFDRQNQYYSIATANLRLVVWYNLNLITEGKYIDEGVVAANVLAQIPSKLSDNLFTYVKKVNIYPMGVTGGAYDKYTMEEERTQYNTFPYGSFVIKLEVQYILNKCATTLIPESGCNNNGGIGGGGELIERIPVVTSMITSSNGRYVVITFNYTVVNPSAFLSDFSVMVDDTEATCVSVSYGTYDNQYKLEVATPILSHSDATCSIAKGNIRAYLSPATGQTSDSLLEEVNDYVIDVL